MSKKQRARRRVKGRLFGMNRPIYNQAPPVGFPNTRSFIFNGPPDDDRFEIPSAIEWDIQDEITMIAWAKANANPPTEAGFLIDKFTSTGGYSILQSDTASGSWRATVHTINDGNQHATSSNIDVTPGVWQCIIGTYKSSTGVLKLYVDGVLKDTETSPGPLPDLIDTNSVDILIGCGTPTPNFEFNGLINDTAIFNVAFNQAEVDEVMATGKPGNLELHTQAVAMPPRLVGYFRPTAASFIVPNWQMEDPINGTFAISQGMDATNESFDTP